MKTAYHPRFIDDGSETITGFTIDGLPAGVVPNVGTDLGNGSYSISVLSG